MVKPAEFRDAQGEPIRNLRILPKVMTPVGSGVLLQRVDYEKEVMTEGGLHVPDQSQDDYRTPVGLVVAVGPDVTHVKRGDFVLVAHRPVPVLFAGVEYRMVMHGNLLAVIDGPFAGKCVHGNIPDHCKEHYGCRITPTQADLDEAKANRSRLGNPVGN